jgi:hypothetical protein
MSILLLEIVANQDVNYAAGTEYLLPVVSHVHNRIEEFVYRRVVGADAVPIAYLENSALNPWANLQIADRTYTIANNSERASYTENGWFSVIGLAYSGPYSDIVATNLTFIDSYGLRRPLFYRHILPVNTVEASLEVVVYGNKHAVDEGYEIDLAAGIVATNYRNYFNPDTGAYKLYFVVSTASDGTSSTELLNPVPVCAEATWEDIDPSTGGLYSGRQVFTKETSSSGYTFYFADADKWYILPQAKSFIKLLAPYGISADDPWYVRISNGDFSALVDNSLRRYYVPEYNYQPFSPYKPYVYASYSKLLWVNDKTLAVPRRDWNVNPDSSMHLQIFIYDYEGNLLRVLTTNGNLDETRYSDTEVYYEADKIVSYDNQAGFVSLALKLHPSWQYHASYYYEATDYEYTAINLNPLMNSTIRDALVVFYVLPDVRNTEQATHHLVVDQGGQIIDCSQGPGAMYPNLQLLNSDGTYNTNTVVGMKYISDTNVDTFTTQYLSGGNGGYGYALIGEVAFTQSSQPLDQIEYDVRRGGRILNEATISESLQANPRVLQSGIVYGEEGQEIPKRGVMIIAAPITLLSSYGGELEQAEAERYIKSWADSTTLNVVEWEYPRSILSGQSFTANQIDLEWTWEASGCTYKLYRRSNVSDEWSLIYSEVNPAIGTLSYSDTDVESDEVWYYIVRIEENNVEFPPSNSLAVKVR